MIDRIIGASLGNRVLVLAAAALLLAWGGWQALRTPVDVFPDLTAPAVTIVAEVHGMAPQEVEKLVTFPIETAMNGAAGVRRVRSNTTVGLAVITVEFDWDTDIYKARQIVTEKLQTARSQLPPDVPPPVLAPITSVMGEVMFIALRSDQHDPMALKTAADWVVRRRLLAVRGVAQVIPTGGLTKQYQVQLRPERLSAYGIAVQKVIDAVGATNQSAGGGFYAENDQEFLIHGRGRVDNVEDIEQTVVARRDGVPVKVSDLGAVKIGPAPRRGTGSYRGQDAVILGIQKQPEANTLELTERLDTTIEEIQASLPAGMRIETDAFRQADFIGLAIENLSAAIRDGAILVVAIVFIFLLSGRATAITLLALPLSIIATLLVLRATGSTINTMTLGGIAIALGALVDDAIIVVENIVRRLRENQALAAGERQANHRVVFDATREIESSIVFATLIIVLVFVPLFFLTGVQGRLLAPLGLAYVLALGASLLVALTVTPVLSLSLLPGSKTVAGAHDTRLIAALKRGYRPLLEAALRFWWLVAAAAAALLVVAAIALGLAGRSFLPEFNEGSLTLSVVTLPGTSLEKSDAIAQRVEKALLDTPEVVATARRTGRAELDPHAQAVYASEIDVSLELSERGKAAMLAELRDELGAIAGANIIIGQPISHRINHMLSGTRTDIAIKIFGEDLAELDQLAKRAETLTAQVPGAVDVSLASRAEVPFLNVDWNRQALARYGLTVAEAGEFLETAYTGSEVSQILEGQAAFDLVVRYPPRFKQNLDAIRGTLLTTESGARVPLHALADVQKASGPNNISRENVQRKRVVAANVAGRDLVGVVEDIRTKLNGELDLPTGYHIEYGGQFESAAEATRTLLILSAVVIAGIFLLLMVALASARDALLVMLNLPLALIGGVVGVYLAGGVLSIAAIIGFITLFGIATRNGVIMIDHIQRLYATGEETAPLDAIRRGAHERLAPILMTALATGLALVPLALSLGKPGSEIQAPMALVILFGLLSSTALNMLVVPALYSRFGSILQAVPAVSARRRIPG
ncbi:efflux RND transporter permease subunit [Salinisphaera sp. P385]|uniref:Efflux RND transporter permease subunit n=1 Tax=Spectribacter acetivorans TaxID=3075603 RepID=A0ABU3B5H5_9GAMM|nr:efflux RND transporter permease subunit [Salinisphaera sp. P385]MDT0617474.1 efflux RND transporter permease subunit [Salinisphaera sp. P385]